MRHRAAAASAAAGRPAADTQSRLAYDRTHLANERTFAAWLRTGLSVAAGGIAVAVIGYGAREFARVPAELSHDSGRRSPASVGAAYALTGIIGALLLAVLLFLWSHRGVVRAKAIIGAAAASTPGGGGTRCG